MTDTTITVSDEVWGYLNARKERGESFDNVLRSELDITSDEDETAHNPPMTDGGDGHA